MGLFTGILRATFSWGTQAVDDVIGTATEWATRIGVGALLWKSGPTRGFMTDIRPRRTTKPPRKPGSKGKGKKRTAGGRFK